MVLQYVLLAYYCPNFEGEAPPWVYLLTCFCVFFYQTMDALDGKQARRTKCSSPMGEIFDHGCDALTLSFMFLAACTVIQTGVSIFWLTTCLGVAIFSFFGTQWEEYHTDILFLGYINVTEAQVFVMIIHFLAYWMGPLWFLTEVEVSGMITLTYGQVLLIIAISGALLSGINNIVTVIRKYKTDFGKLFAAFLQFIPFLQIEALVLIWPRISPEIFLQNPHFILLGCGTLCAEIVGLLVLFRVTKQPYPLFHPILLPTLIPYFLYASSVPQWIEGYYAVAFGVYGIVSYVLCAKAVLVEIGEIFKIDIFTIPPGGYPFNK